MVIFRNDTPSPKMNNFFSGSVAVAPALLFRIQRLDTEKGFHGGDYIDAHHDEIQDKFYSFKSTWSHYGRTRLASSQ